MSKKLSTGSSFVVNIAVLVIDKTLDSIRNITSKKITNGILQTIKLIRNNIRRCSTIAESLFSIHVVRNKTLYRIRWLGGSITRICKKTGKISKKLHHHRSKKNERTCNNTLLREDRIPDLIMGMNTFVDGFHQASIFLILSFLLSLFINSSTLSTLLICCLVCSAYWLFTCSFIIWLNKSDISSSVIDEIYDLTSPSLIPICTMRTWIMVLSISSLVIFPIVCDTDWSRKSLEGILIISI